MALVFTPSNPPKSGAANKLWRWFIDQTGNMPDMLIVCRPGHVQRNGGAAHYSIMCGADEYLVYSPDETIATSIDSCFRSRSGQFILP